MKYIFTLGLLVCALALAACGGTTSATPAPGGGAPTAPARTIPAIPASGPLVVYHKSGGIVALDETLTVEIDGTLTLRTLNGEQQTARVERAELKPLLTLLLHPEFARLAPRYQAAGADMFNYSITLAGQPEPFVTTMDGAEHPEVLGQMIAELDRLRARVGV